MIDVLRILGSAAGLLSPSHQYAYPQPILRLRGTHTSAFGDTVVVTSIVADCHGENDQNGICKTTNLSHAAKVIITGVPTDLSA